MSGTLLFFSTFRNNFDTLLHSLTPQAVGDLLLASSPSMSLYFFYSFSCRCSASKFVHLFSAGLQIYLKNLTFFFCLFIDSGWTRRQKPCGSVSLSATYDWLTLVCLAVAALVLFLLCSIPLLDWLHYCQPHLKLLLVGFLSLGNLPEVSFTSMAREMKNFFFPLSQS